MLKSGKLGKLSKKVYLFSHKEGFQTIYNSGDSFPDKVMIITETGNTPKHKKSHICGGYKYLRDCSCNGINPSILPPRYVNHHEIGRN